MQSKLIGKVAFITDTESIYCGEWGIIAHYDGDVYHIKIANGSDTIPVFDREQFKVPRKVDEQWKSKNFGNSPA